MKCLMLILVLMKSLEASKKYQPLLPKAQIFVFTELVLFYVPKCKYLLKRGDFTLSSVKVKLEVL